MADDEERLVPLTDPPPHETDEFTVDKNDDNGESGSNPFLEEANRQQRDGEEDCSGCYSRKVGSFSIQSGDIISPPSSPPQSQPRSVPRGKLYTKLFPIVHKMVKCVFFSERVPISPLIILLVLSITTFLIGFGVWWKYPPTYNISIESVQVPDHSSSIHWDAYQAALLNQIYNDTNPSSADTSDDASNKKEHSNSGNEFKSESKSGGCCDTFYNHQARMHGSWILELVYRVRSGRKNKNLLEDNRIEHLHSIERHIYNLDSYKKVCHFQYGEGVCDPINSLLTYIYPQSKEDGSYGYDPDWRTELDPRHIDKNKLERVLWYTGGQIGDNLETQLLRAQVWGSFSGSDFDVLTVSPSSLSSFLPRFVWVSPSPATAPTVTGQKNSIRRSPTSSPHSSPI